MTPGEDAATPTPPAASTVYGNQPAPSPDVATIIQEGPPPQVASSRWPLPDVPGYVVSRELARGGMGVVYAAHDPVFDREVAIKVMKSGQDADRFVVESKVTARLPHPGVPPVYALGKLADGRPFLAMKWIEGRTLAEEPRAADRLADLPRVLGVFEAVCQTVGFAHSRGIVHRDLKPQNVMLGSFGEVLVMDWGLAKVLAGGRVDADPTRWRDAEPTVTVKGGTPAYMAPEQARCEDVDARADVFALGALLAVMLTGHPPFEGDTIDEVLQQAAAAELEPVFARLDGCGADRELIGLAKGCLAPFAEDRPADGHAVATVVSAYRAAVEARLRRAERDREVAVAEAREQRRRRRVQLALGGAVVTIIGLVVAGASWQIRQAEKQHAVDQQRAARNQTAAEGLLAQVEAALRDGRADRAERPLEQATVRVEEGGAEGLRPRLARCHADLAMLKTLDEIDNDRWQVSEGRRLNWPALEAKLRAAFTAYGISIGATPPAEAARTILGSCLRERLLTSLEVWWGLDDRNPAVRVVLAAADPDDFRNEARLRGYERARLAWAFRGRRPSEPPVWFAIGHGNDRSQARAVQEQLLLAAHRVRPDYFPLLMDLGALGVHQHEHAATRAGWYRAALALYPDSAAAWSSLGNSAATAGDLREAAAALRHALRLDPRFALAQANLASVLCDQGDLVGAYAACNEAIRLDPGLPKVHLFLGLVRSKTGDLPGAIAAYQESIRLNPHDHEAHYNLGNALRKKDDLRGAAAAYREAVRLNPKFTPAYTNLGYVLGMTGDVKGSVAAYRAVIRLDPTDVAAHYNLGLALGHTHDVRAATAAIAAAVRVDPKYARAYYFLGNQYFAERNYAAAAACAREAVRAEPQSAVAHGMLGTALQQTGDLVGARAALTEAAWLDPQWKSVLADLPSFSVAPPPRPASR